MAEKPGTAAVEVEFHPAFPESLKKETSETLRRVLPTLATEITTLRVAMMDAGGRDDGALACIQTTRHYHSATLWLSGEWFTFDDAKRLRTLRHEAAHVLLDDLTRETQRIVRNFVSDEATSKHLIEILDEAEERVVEALAIAWDRSDV